MTISSLRVLAVIASAWLASVALPAMAASGYQQNNLVSNVLGLAPVQDANLRNPWGIAASASSPLWVANNASGTSTVYDGAGTPQPGPPAPPPPPLVVTMPTSVTAATPENPTGIVFNGSANFNGDRFLFATEQGTIDGWRSALGTNAERLFFGPPGASYTGLGINQVQDTIYAADFGTGAIDRYGPGGFSAAGFTDPNLPAGYAPFNIQDLNGTLWVMYALVTAGDETKGPGLGLVDRFDESGNFLDRFATAGPLNAPWGIAIAPSDFGVFANAVLIGNFGDGLINAFDPTSHSFLGALSDPLGTPISIDGLWGLRFGNGANGAAANRLYFAAGINDEADGLFGYIAAVGGTPPGTTVPEPPTMILLLGAALLLARTRHRTNS